MKKISFGLLFLCLICISLVIYKQHQTINEYRSTLYNQYFILLKPIERILAFQEKGEQFEEETRQVIYEQLENAFADIGNHTGGGVRVEKQVENEYFDDYLNAKNHFAVSIANYRQANTPIEREQAQKTLQEQYESYKQFVHKVETEFVLPFD